MVLKIHGSIHKVVLPNKGYGYVAKEKIPRGTVLIQETPEHELNLNEEMFSDIFQLLYIILTDPDKNQQQKFFNLTPDMKNVNLFRHFEKPVSTELEKLKTLNVKSKKIYKFFKSAYKMEEILLFAAKYISNAFSFGEDGPVILYTGAMLNHSCLPNVIFGRTESDYFFVTVKDIEKDEEICDNYCDITLDKSARQQYLSKQYAFICKCERCVKNDKKLDVVAKNIEKERLSMFGYTKSKKIH